MRLTENEIEYRLRRAIERQLKRNGGHCQITIRRLGKSVYPRKGNQKFVDDPSGNVQKQEIYAKAVELCKEYGGVWDAVAWSRYGNKDVPHSRVYQF